MFKRLKEEDYKDLTALQQLKDEYRELLNGTCWGCDNSLSKAIKKINDLNYLPMVSRMVKFERKQIKDKQGSPTWRMIHLVGKAVKGLPGLVTPNNENDEIVELIKEHYPVIFKANYTEKVSDIEIKLKAQKEAEADAEAEAEAKAKAEAEAKAKAKAEAEAKAKAKKGKQ